MSGPAGAVRRLPALGAGVYWRCLARRGMLHSETEAVEELELEPRAETTHGSDQVEEVIFVVRGTGELLAGGRRSALGPDGLVLVASRGRVRVRAGADGLSMIALRMLPRDVSAALPARVPELREETPR